MMRSLWTAASGMRAQQVNVDTISHNVANVNTIGYKSEQASFKSLLYQNLQSKSTNNAGENKPVAAEVGLGSRVSAITSQFSQGELLATENPFSIAIEGDGFFQLKNSDGELLYTRDGGFNISPVPGGNMLVSANGYELMDVDGNNIIIPEGRYDDNGNLVERYTATDLQVGQDGILKIVNSDNQPINLVNANGNPVKIAMYQFNNPAGLYKTGNNNFSVTVASGEAILEGSAENMTTSKTHQFYTEGSNVDVANEMVNLIIAQRAYEMNSKAIQTSDDMMQQANNLRS